MTPSFKFERTSGIVAAFFDHTVWQHQSFLVCTVQHFWQHAGALRAWCRRRLAQLRPLPLRQPNRTLSRAVGVQGDAGAYSTWGLLAAVFQQVLLPLGLAYVILRAIVANGRRLVDRPQLCPFLAHPWGEDAAVVLGGAEKH